MKKSLITLAVLAASLVPAQAQFKAQPEKVLKWTTFYECGIVALAPRDNDRDPVYKVTIQFSFPDDSKGIIDYTASPTEMTVNHWTVDGKNYSRSEQYNADALRPIKGKLDITWSGTSKKSPTVRMIGHFFNSAQDSRWYYTENQTRNGIPAMEMTSICNTMTQERD